MGKKKSGSKPAVRNRRVIIYTFVLILALFYISAHHTLERERQAQAAQIAEAGAEGPEGLESAHQDAVRVEAPAQELLQTPKSAGEGSLVLREEDMWCLILTNAEYPVPEDYTVELKQIPGTEQSVDARIYDPLIKMLDAMKEAGLSPIICSAYRTLDRQEMLFNRKVKSYVKSGHTKEESYVLARQSISIPGSGEHCLGLAVDFFSRRYQKLEEGFENTPEGIWLREHSWEYGFTLRYERGKESITGISYEPWHFRYVGVEAAKYLKEHGLSLEEFYIQESLYG